MDAVRISDLGQGTNPLRIISMRALPDHPGDRDYPREEWIDQGKPPADEKSAVEKHAKDGQGPDVEQTGHYVVRRISSGLG